MARDPDVSARLKQVPVLSGLSSRDLKVIADAGTYLHVPANWTLMPENTPADKAYILLSGEAAVRRGKEQVATVGAGAVIGEVGILEHRLRTASVVSLSELEVVHFTNDRLADLVARIPALDKALRRTAEEHLAD